MYGVYIKEDRRIEVSRDIIFDENIVYKKSKDVPIASDVEEEPIFPNEEAWRHDNTLEPTTNHEEIEGPSEPV